MKLPIQDFHVFKHTTKTSIKLHEDLENESFYNALMIHIHHYVEQTNEYPTIIFLDPHLFNALIRFLWEQKYTQAPNIIITAHTKSIYAMGYTFITTSTSDDHVLIITPEQGGSWK